MQDTTETKIFLADTYALIELLGGNPDYKPYLNHVLITTKFNLIELYYHFLKDYGKETADKYLSLYSKFVVPITNNSIRTGMEFKLKHKQEKLSYADCIGYALALEFGIKFLTGDEKFEIKENVEFVK
ncbi:PIN domain-containing protein [Candidatus Woesearchaeota archaeon]|nr:PIN domain-containing protein [Candidatus Woesearchaeota archaeon]